MNDEFIKKLLKASLEVHFKEIKVRNDFQDLFTGTNERRRYLEHHPNIQTDITDEDMLLLRIDMALDIGDVRLFMTLTDELKGENYAHCS